MLEKKVFTIALSCSLIWHLLGVQAVNIVWPVEFFPVKFAPINFLGAILEQTNLDNLDKDQLFIDKNDDTSDTLLSKPAQDLQYDQTEIKKSSLSTADLSEKDIPDVLFELKSSEQFIVKEEIGVELERGILFKPGLPVYPDWARELGSDFEIQLKFLILPDGIVGNVENITSSGYPELDEIGVRYVRKWKFMPLSIEASQTEQWGIIKLVFKLQ